MNAAGFFKNFSFNIVNIEKKGIELIIPTLIANINVGSMNGSGVVMLNGTCDIFFVFPNSFPMKLKAKSVSGERKNTQPVRTITSV